MDVKKLEKALKSSPSNKATQKRESQVKALLKDVEMLELLAGIIGSRLYLKEIPDFKKAKNLRLQSLIKGMMEFTGVFFKGLIEILYFTFNKHLT